MRLSLALPPALWAALISIVSHISDPPGQPASAWQADSAHLVEFLILGLLCARAVQGRATGWSGPLVWSVAFAGSAAFGAVDETHQAFVPGRDAAVMDWLFDTLGAAAGAGLWVGYRRGQGSGG